ncbi:ribosomal protein L17 [Oikeobacillus pervagus]|uniref:Ribosomal protein L17 n=1 Tax=Oikeobacillus pervagus TaxID=1325931 RepID=A0AAJ1WHU7_9BACI|nr:hypothetical protein [Oikeobacillus pervagus]MDQ0213990.1 ribosomal protein L17 [Oikeobacillus pervagus]
MKTPWINYGELAYIQANQQSTYEYIIIPKLYYPPHHQNEDDDELVHPEACTDHPEWDDTNEVAYTSDKVEHWNEARVLPDVTKDKNEQLQQKRKINPIEIIQQARIHKSTHPEASELEPQKKGEQEDAHVVAQADNNKSLFELVSIMNMLSTESIRQLNVILENLQCLRVGTNKSTRLMEPLHLHQSPFPSQSEQIEEALIVDKDEEELFHPEACTVPLEWNDEHEDVNRNDKSDHSMAIQEFSTETKDNIDSHSSEIEQSQQEQKTNLNEIIQQQAFRLLPSEPISHVDELGSQKNVEIKEIHDVDRVVKEKKLLQLVTVMKEISPQSIRELIVALRKIQSQRASAVKSVINKIGEDSFLSSGQKQESHLNVRKKDHNEKGTTFTNLSIETTEEPREVNGAPPTKERIEIQDRGEVFTKTIIRPFSTFVEIGDFLHPPIFGDIIQQSAKFFMDHDRIQQPDIYSEFLHTETNYPDPLECKLVRSTMDEMISFTKDDELQPLKNNRIYKTIANTIHTPSKKKEGKLANCEYNCIAVRIPVVVGEYEIEFEMTDQVGFEQEVLSLKEILKHVSLNRCQFIPTKYTKPLSDGTCAATKGKLQLEGEIQQQITYSALPLQYKDSPQPKSSRLHQQIALNLIVHLLQNQKIRTTLCAISESNNT